jgi:hypothetical protein
MTKETDLRKIKYSMPAIEDEITSFLAAMTNENPDVKIDEDFRADLLEGTTDYLDIVDSLILNLHITNAYKDGIKDARARLDQREERLERKIELIRRLLKKMLEMADLRSVKAPSGTVSIGAKPPSVEIVDEGLIPDEYMRISISPSKTLIGNKLKAGEDVPGARLTNGGETLIVR